MNAELVKRQSKDANTKLFDVNGPSSVGMLPQQPVIPRLAPLEVPLQPSREALTGEIGFEFNIGGSMVTEPLPDRLMELGNEKLMDARTRQSQRGVLKAMGGGQDREAALV